MVRKHFIPRDFLQEASKPAKHLARKYNKGVSTIYKWRYAVQDGEKDKIQRRFDINGRILGILRALGKDDGKRFVLCYRDKRILQEVKNFFGLKAQLITGKSRTGIQYRLYITGDVRQSLLKWLQELGWSNRNAEIRKYPEGPILDREFLQAYIEIHSSLDYPKGKPRLRIYGNKHFIFRANEVISREFAVGLKTPQKITEKTYCLYYQKKSEIERIIPSPGTRRSGVIRLKLPK